jgi:hypothetical protein
LIPSIVIKFLQGTTSRSAAVCILTCIKSRYNNQKSTSNWFVNKFELQHS